MDMNAPKNMDMYNIFFLIQMLGSTASNNQQK